MTPVVVSLEVPLANKLHLRSAHGALLMHNLGPLSIELDLRLRQMHCSPPQQRRLATLMVEIIAEALLSVRPSLAA